MVWLFMFQDSKVHTFSDMTKGKGGEYEKKVPTPSLRKRVLITL